MALKYTEEQLGYMAELRAQGFTWAEVAPRYNTKFKTRKTADTLRMASNSHRSAEPTEDVEGLGENFSEKSFKSRVRKMEKSYGQAIHFEKSLLEGVVAHLEANPIALHKPYKGPKKPAKSSRTLVACVSDTHFGANISKDEMYGLNEFSWTIASRRMASFFEQVANYKTDKRSQTDLVVQLNGDIIAGLIHNTEWFVDLLTTQFSGTVHLLSQGLSYLAQNFSKVTVVCTPGNHGRNMAKIDKGRATTHKWDSYETMIYAALKYALIGRKNVEFVIPEAPFALYKIQGHNVLQTHGDTIINVGNPGKSLNMASISHQINRVTSSDLIKNGENLDILCVGHVHVPTAQILDTGCTAVINGCLSGLDPFAQSIGIFGNNPTQLLFEVTEDHPVGDIRMVQVKGADAEARFDKIIKPFSDKF